MQNDGDFVAVILLCEKGPPSREFLLFTPEATTVCICFQLYCLKMTQRSPVIFEKLLVAQILRKYHVFVAR